MTKDTLRREQMSLRSSDATPRSTAELFLRACSDNAARTVLIDGKGTVTYAELRDQAEAFAASLIRAGIEPGDRVAHWMGNCTEWAVVKFGTELAGAVHVPLNTRYKSEDAAYVLAQSKATVLVFSTTVSTNFVDVIGRILPELPTSAPGELQSERCPKLRAVVCLGADMPGAWSYGTFVETGACAADRDEIERRVAAINSNDLVNILYTSGTTGLPKGALVTHGNVIANATSGPAHINRTGDDRWLLALPLFHTFGCMMGLLYPITLGASTVLLERFEARDAMRAIQEHGCTVMEGVPTMFSDMLDHPDRDQFDLSSWRKLYVGGAHSPESFLVRLRDGLGVEETLTGYGMTEHAGLSCATHVGDPFDVISRTIGEPLEGAFEFQVRDPHSGHELPPGAEGELCARGVSVCRGYYEKPEETRKAFYEDGWLRSGDLGMIDPESGYFRITGRLKDIYITGGENVSPVEVERVLAQHPAVSEVHVCGVPDRRLGEVGTAFVKRKRGSSASSEELIAYCRERVASFKTPRYVLFADEFPQTASGKIQRFKLRDLAVNELELNVYDLGSAHG